MRWRAVFGAAIAVLLAAGIASADTQTIPLSRSDAQLELLDQRGDVLHFHVEVGDLKAMEVTTKEGQFTRLFIPGFHSSQTVGAPELPMMNRLVSIPYGARARIVAREVSSRMIDLADFGLEHPLMPAQPSMPKNADPETWPFVYDRSAYQVDRVSQDLGKVVELGRLRAMDLGRVEISPVEYFPATNQIRVVEAIDVEVSFEGADHVRASELIERTHSSFFDGLYSRMANFRAFQDDYPDRVRDVVTMVIITPPDFETQLADYVDWKTERGFHVIVGVTGTPEVGSTTTSIQSYIHGLYNSPAPGIPAPSFALFVGDVAQVPTFYESGDASDRPYCAVDGDVVPDIYYGRFSATNPTQLQAILDKTLMYDQYTMPDPSYLGEVTMIAGEDWAGHDVTHGNGQINYGTTHYFNAAHGIYSNTYLAPGSGAYSAQIIQTVSEGVSYINYTAHGSTTSWSDPSFTQTNVRNLGNNGKYCLAVGNCCLTSSYDLGECFAETWLREANKGAIGYIGGSNSTYWDEDYWWGVGYHPASQINGTAWPYESTGLGAYDGLFHDHGEPDSLWYVTNDAIIFCGNLAVMEAGSSRITYYWNIYNLMGDPSLSTYLGVPAANPVSHPTTVFTTSTSITIDAVHNSYVGLTQDGVLVGAGTVGESGTLEIDFLTTPLTPGVPLHLVVTAQNREPYIEDLDVIVPATVIIDPTTIDANVTTDVTVTVYEADGVTPQVGINVWAEGLGYSTTPVPTDVNGVAVITVNYPYGPTLDIVGQEPGQTYRLFTEMINVNALPLTAPDLTVTTDIALSDTFALNLPGVLHAAVGQTGATLWAQLPGGAEYSTLADSLEVTPAQLGNVTGIIAVSGYDLYSEIFPVIEAYGQLAGTVSTGGSPLASVIVQGYDASMALAFEAVTNASGEYDVGEDILVADYTIMIDHFGYLHYEQPYFLNYGPNVLDIDLTPAPSGILTGMVTETGTGTPLLASIKVYRTDNGSLYTEALSDSTGAFTTTALPYFDYDVIVRASHHVPVTISLTIDQPVVNKSFVLDPTAGDLLVLDDNAKGAERPAKVTDKGLTQLADAYSAPAGKAVADLMADLEYFGYYVTMEDAATSDPETWTDYDLVIVSCGDNTSTLPNSATRAALVSFVDAGGHLLLEGGEVGYDHYGSGEFAQKVLHSTDWNHDSSGSLTVADPTHYVMSVPNTITGPVTFTYVGYGDQDAMVPLSDAEMVGSWSTYPTDASVITFDTNPAPQGGQLVYFAFNYSAMDAAVRSELLENAVNWLLTLEFGNCSVSGTAMLEGETNHSGITVQALPGGGTTTTAADGSYSLPGLFAGTYQIIASKEGWSTEIEEVTLSDGQQMTDVDFLLTPVFTIESCENPGLAIPDNNPTGVTSTTKIILSGQISAVEVFVDITHTYIGDLVIRLTSPLGLSCLLHNRTGGSTHNLYGWYPLELEPAESLDRFIGDPMEGEWTLHVSDQAGADTGTLNTWCVRITYAASAVDVSVAADPPALALSQSFPNPFSRETQIRFALPREMEIDLSVYDIRGRRVANVVSGKLPAGHHTALWAGRDGHGRPVASGVYFYRLVTDERTLTRKMLRLK